MSIPNFVEKYLKEGSENLKSLETGMEK